MKNVEDVRRMARAGARAVLVGESLMRAGKGVADLARQLASIPVATRAPGKAGE
jgi:indole-3-glycerol phosphate synthase